MASQDHGIHSFEECMPEGSDYFQHTLGRRRNSTHNKRREDGSKWRSSSHHPKKIPQVMRNMNDSTLEETLIHISICIRNDEWRRWWRERLKKESTYETNKDKYSIVISWYCFCYAFLYIQLCYPTFCTIVGLLEEPPVERLVQILIPVY